MHDAGETVPALSGKCPRVETSAELSKHGYRCGGLARDRFGDVGVTQPDGSPDCIRRVRLRCVARAHSGCDPALGELGAAAAAGFFGYNSYAPATREGDGCRQPRYARPHHEDVERVVGRVRRPGHLTRPGLGNRSRSCAGRPGGRGWPHFPRFLFRKRLPAGSSANGPE